MSVCSAYSRGLVASAQAGLHSTTVLLYPGGIGHCSDFVRGAYCTNTKHLADDLRLQGSVSKFHSERLAALQEEYDDAVRAGEFPEKVADDTFRAREWDLCVHSAEVLALMNIVREVFGSSRAPSLSTYERQKRSAAVAALEAAEGGGGEDAVDGVAPALKLPSFLESQHLQRLWKKAWGIGCFQALTLDRNDLVWLVRFVCLSFERGEMVMYDKKVADEWEKARKARGDTCKSTTPSCGNKWMALCGAFLIPKGLVEVVCTEAQKTKAGGRPFVVRFA